jgi:surface antigen-like variable number repeat protein
MPLQRSEAQPEQRVHGHSLFYFQTSKSPCSQPPAVQSSLIRRAQKNKYSIRRVEFIGNEKTRDSVLRKRILLQEGNVFTRAILIKSLASVSTLKTIYPVTLNDVVAQLKDEEKTIDVLICFKERRRRTLKGVSFQQPPANKALRLTAR